MKNEELVIGGSWFLEGLQLMFIGFKMANIITWSWWLVFAPTWVPLLLGLIIFLIIALLMGFIALITIR